jgi:hypothetical protein
MYKRQADNYAAMEKGMQSLTRTMERLDDAMASIVGAKIRTRGIGSIIKGALPMAGTIIGAGLGALVGNPVAGAMIGSAAGNFGAKALGDATGEQETNAQKLNAKAGGTSAKTSGTPSNITRSQGALSKLNPKMREKVEAMMRENSKLWIGGGVRTTAEQKAMFMDRYRPTEEKTDVFWKGQYWKRVKGIAAAPPGLSYHEIGLAVDMQPDTENNWLKDNAHRFGLRSFWDVNNEPFHLQPSELPAGRMQYEKSGAPWGHNGQVSDPTDINAIVNNLAGMEHSFGGGTSGQGTPSKINTKIQDYSGLSMNDAISAMAPTGGGTRGSGKVGKSSVSSIVSAAVGSTPGSSASSGSRRSPNKLSASTLVSLLYNAGFRGRELEAMAGIAARETVGFDANALNGVNRDYSFGLYQINMKNDDPANPNMGNTRLKMFGLNNPEQLYDPATNVRAAKMLFDSYKKDGKNPFQPWLGPDNAKKLGKKAHSDKSGRPNTVDDYGNGQKVLTQGGWKRSGTGMHDWAKQGDPVSGMGMGQSMPKQTPSATTVLIQQQPSASSGNSGDSYNVTISPTIHLHGGGNTAMDAQKISREIAAHVERQMRLTSQRGR